MQGRLVAPDARRAAVWALALYLVLSLVLTYPLALHLPDAVEDRQDALLNVWIMAWDGHQLLADPLRLFDANIFHPYRRTLAYSELLFGNALLALPITAASANPVLGYNLALLLSFVLSAWGTYLLVVRLTRSPGAAFVAGTVFAFCSYRLSNLAQAQLLTTHWMPLLCLSLWHLVRRPRLRHAATCALFLGLQALSSFYYGILLALAAAVLGIGYRLVGRRPLRAGLGRLVLHLSLAAGCAALLILPFALPYFQVQRELGFERTLADSEPFSASLRQYLLVPPGSLLHGLWLPSDDQPAVGGYPVDALFPGLAALALGLCGTIRGRGGTRWAFVALLLLSFLLSLGPRLYLAPGRPAGLELSLPYAWLYAALPGFKALRAPVRFDALVMLALAVLAGYGVASLVRECGGARRGARKGLAVPALLAGLVLLESLVWPAAHAEPVPVGAQVPPVYRWLAGQDRQVILELPMAFAAGGPQLDYQYLSAYHWQTTPDGYSGFIPPKRGQIAYEMERFPSERSVSLLQALGVASVVVHTDRYPFARWEQMRAAIAALPDLVPGPQFGADRVYQVRPRTAGASQLTVTAYLPARAAAGQPYTAYLIVVNHGERSHALRPTDLLRPAVSWSAGEQSWPSQPSADLSLVTSPGGGTAVIPLVLDAPPAPGTYTLEAGQPSGPLGEWHVEGQVEVGPSGSPLDPSFPVPATLAAWSIPPQARPGEPLRVDLTWHALGKIDAYYSVYVKLLDAAGVAVAGWDGQPQNGAAPTLLWEPGGTVEDTVVLAVPADAAAGDYTVEVGVYRAEDLARCLTLDAAGRPVDRLVPGTVQIVP